MMLRRTHLQALAALAWTGAPAVRAQGFPSRTIQWIVPFPPGGPNDFFARQFAGEISPLLGQQVVVENRAGGGGVVGTATMLRAAADGHMMGVTTLGSMAISPHVSRSVPYAVPADFTMVCALARVPQGLFATRSLAADNLGELVALAKTHPGRLSIAAAGIAGMSHLAAELLRAQTQAEITVVPYRGAAPAVSDLLAGHVQLLFADLTGMLGHVQAGKLKLLTLASATPSPLLAGVQTAAQAGYPQLLAENAYCLVGPAGLPSAVLARYSDAVRVLSERPALRDLLAAQGAQTAWSLPAQFAAQVQQESARWGAVARSAGVRID
jgi:tripartite-type tricarboxylate transporter receptor subunit TctC